MSNLNSQFNVEAGIPPNGYSALQGEIPQLSTESPILTEGKIAKITVEAGGHLHGVFTALTSAKVQAVDFAMNLPDYPYLIIQGADQSDAVMSGKLVALRLKTGVIFKAATLVAFTIGDLVRANAGALAAITAGVTNIPAPGVDVSNAEQAIGVVLEYNATTGYVTIAS